MTPVESGMFFSSLKLIEKPNPLSPQQSFCEANKDKENKEAALLKPVKEFLKESEVPAVIDKASQSVRQVCLCRVRIDTCFTMTAIEKPGQFITNEHVVQVLLDMQEEAKKRPEISCNPPFFVSIDNTALAEESKLDLDALDKLDPKSRDEELDKYQKKQDTLLVERDKKAFKVTLRIKKRGEFKPVSSENSPRLNTEKDLALIEIPELEDTPPLKLAERQAKEDDEIYHLGFPATRSFLNVPFLFYKPRTSSGHVISAAEKKSSGSFLGINGTSGGPVLDQNGHVVGVFWGKEKTFREEFHLLGSKISEDYHAGTLKAPPEKSYYTPVERLKEFLKQGEIIPGAQGKTEEEKARDAKAERER